MRYPLFVFLAMVSAVGFAHCGGGNDIRITDDPETHDATLSDSARGDVEAEDSFGGNDAASDTAGDGRDAATDAIADARETGVDANDAAFDAGDSSSTGFPLINGCEMGEYEDDSMALLRIVTGPNTSSPSPYTPSCMKIAKGQSVTFNGNFNAHGLEPSPSDPNNPMSITSSGTTVTFTFNTPGVFGFHCQTPGHQSVMQGAIWVTP